MKLSEFICYDALIPKLNGEKRDDVIRELAKALHKAKKLGRLKVDDIAEAVIQRENEASTGIGKGVAVPHVKHPKVKGVTAAVGCSEQGIDFDSLDKQPAYTVILLISSSDNPDRHLQAMETIFHNLNKDDFRRFLRQAQDADQIWEIIQDADESAI